MSTDLASSRDRGFLVLNAVVSAGALALLSWLLLLRHGEPGHTADLSFMPAVNATLNATAAVLLTAGWVAIKRRARIAHRNLMISAFVASSLFLVGYLAYHYVHGDSHYVGTPGMRAFYLLVLASHVLLSATVIPLALSAFYFAWRRAFVKHKRVTRWLAPIWLYVSVTGVLVFVLLRNHHT